MEPTASFIDAMNAQPANLELALATVARALDAAALPRWGRDESVAFVAMGASLNSAQVPLAALAQRGRPAVAVIASDVADGLAAVRADHSIIVSESGRSPEPLAAAGALPPGSRIGITNFPDQPIREATDVVLGLGGFPDSPVYTSGYTATILAYALLLDRVGALDSGEEAARLPERVAEALRGYAPIAEAAGGILAGAASIDVVGRGASLASAAELSLMVREGLRTPSSAFETYQYLHGPMEVLSADDVLVLFGDGRETTIPSSVLDAGVRVVLVTSAEAAELPASGHPGLTVITVPSGLGLFERAVVETVIGQLLIAAAVQHKPFPLEKFLYHQDDTKLPVRAG
ncbi:SIS domain-containing protein [Leifsonia shinshuensis]|uniref:Glutamine--fructose-6-phosphate aminotransferase [isomerizing] n=1 Tax=Leifsonia shinshuensis TaxID=150026 RepID=A0A853D1I3_9MICO|nr:SIS domain-containing protein [Leifsonia shinshuensis]NYJ25341.1 fructoselysine-6-P-deglycase FrlB-like protein [Leifsonia shinshuensis]